MSSAVLPAVPPLVQVSGAGVRTNGHWVLRGADLTVTPSELVVVTGRARGARTLLLLAAAGRLRLEEGLVTAAPGRTLGLGVVRGVNDLDDALTVADAVTERAALLRRRLDAAHVLATVGLDLPASTRLRDVPPPSVVLLGAALALAGQPDVLVLDDVDDGGSAAEVREVWAALRALADAGTAVLAGALDPSPLADRSVDADAVGR